MGCSYASQARTPNTLDGGPKSATPATGSPGRLLDNYQLGKVLGQGAFGIVYYCKKKGSREEYAVKMIDKVETPLVGIKHEVKMLQDLKHSSIVVLHDVFYEKAFVCIVMTIYKGGDMIEGMQRHWKKHGMLPIPVVASLIKQMITSLDWLHKHCVVHRDVKGDNFLMDCKDIADPECRIVLSDFGTARTLETPTARLKSRCGTKTYWAPEFFQMNYGLKVDVWALGVIMYGLVTGRFPFKGEDDVNNKKIQVPQRASQECGNLLMGLLNRNEELRLSAKDALKHNFCEKAEVVIPEQNTAGAKGDDEEGEEGISRDVVEVGAGDRRLVLMQAMMDVDKKKQTAVQLRAISPSNPLQVVHHNGKKTKLLWYGQDELNKHDLNQHQGARPLGEKDDTKYATAAQKNMENMFLEFKINTENWGTGSAKTRDEFNNEIQKGAALLLLDASTYKDKALVRVVDLVLLRIAAKDKSGVVKYLIKKSEKFPDGRQRENINQLPGTKKEPNESAMDTITRIVKDRMRLQGVKVNFTVKETYEKTEEDSPSFPGMRTVYRTEIFEGTLTNANPDSKGFSAKDSANYERSYEWTTEAKCKQLKIQLKGDSKGEISTLVNAPVSPKEENIRKQLADGGLLDLLDCKPWEQRAGPRDPKKTWAPGKWKIFMDELAKGEATLIFDKQLLRVVDIVVCKVTNKEKGSVLVEVEEEVESQGPDGGPTITKKSLNWLPAVKRRPDENVWAAAKRCVNKYLEIDENAVSFDTSSVLIQEEEKESETFPKLKSLYRKRIITANVAVDESNVIIN